MWSFYEKNRRLIKVTLRFKDNDVRWKNLNQKEATVNL